MAYEESFILSLAKETFEKWKAVNQQSTLKQKSYKEKLPEYYPGYTLAYEYAEHIRDHAVVGRFPEKLFQERSPNQTEKEQKYIRATYKQVTLPVYIDYVSTVTRGDNPNNVAIKYEVDENNYSQEKSLQTYLETGIKDYGSLEVWRKTILPSVKTIDANGIIVTKPWDIPLLTEEPTEEYPEGRTIIDPDNLLEPIPYYYPCEKVVAFLSDNYYLVELDEKSMVNVGGSKDEPYGKIYEFIDDENIWRVIQYGKYNEGLFRTELYFNHAEEVVPVTVLQGIPVIYNGKILWQSPFLYSVDLLDLVVLNHSNLQVSINTCVYPYAVAIGSKCNFEYESRDENHTLVKCNDGIVYDSATGKEKSCPACEGSGLRDRRSPLGVLLLKPGTTREPGEETFKNKPLEFISPEVHTLEFLESKIAKDEMKARQILHLHTSNSTVKGSEDMKVTGMALDNQAMQAFVKTVSDQVWDIDKFVIDRIGWQRYGDAYKKPTVIPPSTFEFLTPEDYMEQVSNAVKAGLPPFMVRAIILKFLQAVFYNQKESIAVFEIVTQADRILTMDSQDVAIGLARNNIANWEKVLHDSSVPLIQELIRENPEYLEQEELQDKIDQLIAKAKEKADAISAAISAATAPATGNIIKDILGTPAPVA